MRGSPCAAAAAAAFAREVERDEVGRGVCTEFYSSGCVGCGSGRRMVDGWRGWARAGVRGGACEKYFGERGGEHAREDRIASECCVADWLGLPLPRCPPPHQPRCQQPHVVAPPHQTSERKPFFTLPICVV